MHQHNNKSGFFVVTLFKFRVSECVLDTLESGEWIRLPHAQNNSETLRDATTKGKPFQLLSTMFLLSCVYEIALTTAIKTFFLIRPEIKSEFTRQTLDGNLFYNHNYNSDVLCSLKHFQ